VIEKPSTETHDLIRQWIEQVLTRTGWSSHRLALEAGVSPATVSRALNDGQYLTSTRTIEKIVRATGIAAPQNIGASGGPVRGGFAEPEAVYQGARPNRPAAEGGPHAAVWRLQSESLRQAGVLPGDMLTVDPDTPPRAGDIVCVQVLDAAGEAQTVFRVYDRPFAVTAHAHPDHARKPLMIDDERVQVWGTVVRVERNIHA
jgi:lambda repressor-like predicted transcriptional regulator